LKIQCRRFCSGESLQVQHLHNPWVLSRALLR